jgi:GMP synthase-like glutamine amidotransferase
MKVLCDSGCPLVLGQQTSSVRDREIRPDRVSQAAFFTPRSGTVHKVVGVIGGADDEREGRWDRQRHVLFEREVRWPFVGGTCFGRQDLALFAYKRTVPLSLS